MDIIDPQSTQPTTPSGKGDKRIAAVTFGAKEAKGVISAGK
jgi:hypothetical protein